MAEIIIALGADAAGNLTNLYTGPDSAAGHKALGDAIAGGTLIGYVFENPIASTTLRAPVAEVASAPAPTITTLNPNTGPANADINLAINGTGFDPATVKVLVGATELAPYPTPTETDLGFALPAAEIATPGTVQIAVKNGDGQQSGSLDFTAT